MTTAVPFQLLDASARAALASQGAAATNAAASTSAAIQIEQASAKVLAPTTLT